MKTLFLSFIFAIGLINTGCQKNVPINPVNNPTAVKSPQDQLFLYNVAFSSANNAAAATVIKFQQGDVVTRDQVAPTLAYIKQLAYASDAINEITKKNISWDTMRGDVQIILDKLPKIAPPLANDPKFANTKLAVSASVSFLQLMVYQIQQSGVTK